MNAWVSDFQAGKAVIEARIVAMQAASLLSVQRKHLYTHTDFAACQQRHQAQVRWPRQRCRVQGWNFQVEALIDAAMSGVC